MDLRRLGKNIRQIRAKKGWTQEEMAEIAECSWRYIQAIEQGKRIPSIKWLNDLSKKIKVPLKEFFVE